MWYALPELRRHSCTSSANYNFSVLQKQQALLGQMLLEGYGCDVNQSAARMWVDKAKRRGYRMAGVYCEL